jgi:hypothetical protein
MIVLQSTIDRVHRDRDFGRVEATVTLVAKTQTGQPPRLVRIRTSVPARGVVPLRERLIQDAVRLARHLPRRAGPVRNTA